MGVPQKSKRCCSAGGLKMFATVTLIQRDIKVHQANICGPRLPNPTLAGSAQGNMRGADRGHFNFE
eukprot:4298442-Pyramimonas_sp.AAC.1